LANLCFEFVNQAACCALGSNDLEGVATVAWERWPGFVSLDCGMSAAGVGCVVEIRSAPCLESFTPGGILIVTQPGMPEAGL
jgi:hypothetical protein